MELLGLAHLVVGKLGLFGLALIWTLKVAVTWMLYRWWRLRRAAGAAMKD